MAAPMRNPQGLPYQPTPSAINFDTDDNSEWDIGVGDLIIDLDADIEKEADNMASTTPVDTTQTTQEQDHRATLDNKGLKMKIKRTKPGTKTCEAKHEIVKSAHQISPLQNSVSDGKSSGLQNGSSVNKRNVASNSALNVNSNSNSGSNHRREKREAGVVNTGPGPPEESEKAPEAQDLDAQPVIKKRKEEAKDMLDVCVGTSVGTITEPDCLGPCEPGTSVTLEGIVWHETEGGVLVVNVTWRGKTYVGTLLDCTKHDWAPPRFCDSPIEEMDARTPKGRGKRETRSSVHSKLRNGGNKTTRKTPSEPANPTVATKVDKRKSRVDETPEPAPVVVTPPVKKAKSVVNHSPPGSPSLLECPEPNCNKKYKHANGLKYHQSHAHGGEDKEEKDTISASENDDSSNIDPPSPCAEKVVIKKDEAIEIPKEDNRFRANAQPFNKDKIIIKKDESNELPPKDENLCDNTLKAKPMSELMPDDKKVATCNFKKKLTRGKSPCLRDDEQPTSPAYSDISDDGNTSDKNKDTQAEMDKKNSFGIYPFFNQQQTYVRSAEAGKCEEKVGIVSDKEGDKHEMMNVCEKNPQHYSYPYGYVATGFPYGVESGFAIQQEDKDDQQQNAKQSNESKPSTIVIPNNSQSLIKDNKHMNARPPSPHSIREQPILQHGAMATQNATQAQNANDNHQILKESIEMKEQMRAGFLYREEDIRRYYMYPDNRRKEAESTPTKLQAPIKPSKSPKPSPMPTNTIKVEDFVKKEDGGKLQQKDGSKVNEAQNHPQQYTYIHSGYLQSNPYAGLAFDSAHPVYRNMSPVQLVPSPYGAGPYLHRFHNPEDLSRSQNQNPKPLDILQHANQFYPHKIHELQERALKSPPTPKGSQVPPNAVTQASTVDQNQAVEKNNPEKIKTEEGKEGPPPQHHVHTHHHTHVGLGYPIMAPQYPAPFGAGVNAAVNVINQFPPK
uniref:Putative zinc finger protein 608-like isoform x1 n=1 Tax=Xenopsylla cheopis TaxID=163159 RepID=A0A6M2DQQ9_XENCH